MATNLEIIGRIGKNQEKHRNKVKSKKEEANQDQETPKLDVTKESTEDKIDASERSECNRRELGE